MLLHCILPRRCMPPCHGYHQHQMLQIQHGRMGGFGCSVSQCRILRIIKGKAPGCPCTTDWDHANLVLCSRLHRSDRSHQRPGQVPAPRFKYRIKEKKEEHKPVANPEKPKIDVVQIGEVKVPIKDTGKKPMYIEKSVEVPSQKLVMANDHEAGSSKSAADKYHQPRWCPSGLTHTQKRKL